LSGAKDLVSPRTKLPVVLFADSLDQK